MKSRNSFIGNFKSIFDCKTNKEIYNQADKPLYIRKSPENLPEEGEWARVQRIRKETQEELL